MDSRRPAWIRSLLMSLSLIFVTAGISLAEEKAVNNQPYKDGEIRSGVIASTGQIKKSGAVDVSSSTTAAGDQESPVSASIRRLGGSKCEVTVSSNSASESFSVNYVVEGYNANGSKVLNQSFSSSIAPNKPVKRQVTCTPDATSLQVVLKSGRLRK